MTRDLKDKNAKIESCNFRNRKSIKYLKNFFVVSLCIVIVMLFMSNICFAGNVENLEYDNVFSEFDYILNYVQSKLLDLSIPGAIVAVAIGVFMKKFSMGKPDSIEKGNKLIRDTLIGFLFLNSMPIIVKTIKGFTSGTLLK